MAVNDGIAKDLNAPASRVERDEPLLHARAREPLDPPDHLVREDHVLRLDRVRRREHRADRGLLLPRDGGGTDARRGEEEGRGEERRAAGRGGSRSVHDALAHGQNT
jgi:hypothetical protein